MTEEVELLTVIPARTDGTVVIDVPLGRGKFHTYTFKDEPPACLVEPEHVAFLTGLGTFMDRQAYEDEQALLARVEQRRKSSPAFARQVQAKALAFDPLAAGDSGANGDDGDDAAVDMNAAPIEGGAKPTGRVRRANSKAAS